jgi:hypothetical protein
VLCDQIADGHVASVLHEVLRRARRGDMKAAAIVLSRCWPPRKARFCFPIPPVATTDDLPRALGAVAEAVSAGTLSPDEAASIAQILNAQANAAELIELRREVKEIERRLNEFARSD